MTFISLQAYLKEGSGIIEPDLLDSITDCLQYNTLENVSEEFRFIFYLKEGVQQHIKVHTNDRGVLGFMVSDTERQLFSNLIH